MWKNCSIVKTATFTTASWKHSIKRQANYSRQRVAFIFSLNLPALELHLSGRLTCLVARLKASVIRRRSLQTAHFGHWSRTISLACWIWNTLAEGAERAGRPIGISIKVGTKGPEEAGHTHKPLSDSAGVTNEERWACVTRTVEPGVGVKWQSSHAPNPWTFSGITKEWVIFCPSGCRIVTAVSVTLALSWWQEP